MRRKIARGLIAIMALVGFAYGARALRTSGLLEQALAWLAGLGPWAPLIFLLIYVVAVVCFVPASVLTMGAGIVFGMAWGTTYVLTSAMIAATVCFLISRHLARGWVVRRYHTHPKFRALDDAVGRHGWKVVFLVRLAPAFPFSFTNYAFGLTRIPWWQYTLASLALIPATTMYVYFGTLLGDLSGLQHGRAVPLPVKAGIAIVTFAIMAYLTRFAARALKDRWA